MATNGQRVKKAKKRSPRQRSEKLDRMLAGFMARGDVVKSDLASLLEHYNEVFAGKRKARLDDLFDFSPKKMSRLYDSWLAEQKPTVG